MTSNASPARAALRSLFRKPSASAFVRKYSLLSRPPTSQRTRQGLLRPSLRFLMSQNLTSKLVVPLTPHPPRDCQDAVRARAARRLRVARARHARRRVATPHRHLPGESGRRSAPRRSSSDHGQVGAPLESVDKQERNCRAASAPRRWRACGAGRLAIETLGNQPASQLY